MTAQTGHSQSFDHAASFRSPCGTVPVEIPLPLALFLQNCPKMSCCLFATWPGSRPLLKNDRKKTHLPDFLVPMNHNPILSK